MRVDRRGGSGILALALPVVVFATGCVQAVGPIDPSPVAIPVASANADFYGVAWLRDGSIVASYSQMLAAPTAARLTAVDQRSGALTPLPISLDPECVGQDFDRPDALPDGALAFLNGCNLPLPAGTASTVDRYEPTTKAVAPAVTLDPAHGTYGQFSFSPDRSDLVISVGDQLCNSISIYHGSTVATPPVTVTENGHSFRLDTVTDGGAPCDGNPIVDWPDWSPDGSTIAFVASTGAIGLDGPGRLDAPFTVWLLDTHALTTKSLITGVGGPRGLRWSPAGTMLALSGTIGGTNGTWLIDGKTGVKRLLSSLHFAWLAWSPDGRSIVGTHDLTPLTSELVIVSTVTH